MKQLFIGIILLLTGGGALAAELQKYPDVVSVTVRLRGSDTFDFDVTVSSPYDTPARYADAFRVMGPVGGSGLELTFFRSSPRPSCYRYFRNCPTTTPKISSSP
jgi:hypothetical protein